jgi:hypothetical protein
LIFSSKRFRIFFGKIEGKQSKLAEAFAKLIIHNLDNNNNRGISFELWFRILLLSPNILRNIDFFVLIKHTHHFIREVFNKNPKTPKVMGSPWLYFAVVTAAHFTHIQVGPYEYDRLHRPMSAEVALVRPTTQKGRKMKLKYDSIMKKYTKVTDRYYRCGARRWYFARVKCPSVAEAERELQMEQGELHHYLYKQPWDEIMGYKKN